ncbi:hypothetical protein F5Y16DRAFT_195978 [Xylariaceae sp. FL0255]|nr:hypothetical protein F5Y16DRAFT_195978 [Xylariaceae sp. FL0255]
MFSQKKPYSAVTVTVERLTAENYDEDDLSGIPDLVEVIKLQATGPAEAARALRKKLKYGSVHRQIRALVLLDGLIQNAGPRFQRTFIDEPLLERLRVCGTSDLSDPDVKKKCSELYRNWAVEYKNTPGLERIAKLYKELPRRKEVVTQDKSKVLRETEQDPFRDSDDDAEKQRQSPVPVQSPQASASRQPVTYPQSSQTVTSYSHTRTTSNSGSGFFSSSSKDKKKKDKGKNARKPFNLEAEKETMKVAIAESSIAAINLSNALQSINRERERISENVIAVENFETCKRLRRKILRYIYYVTDERWLGGLLHANDELVMALMTFEQLDRSIDADSDSEDELAEQAHLYRMATEKHQQAMSPVDAAPSSPVSDMAGLSIQPSPPSRPIAPPRPSAQAKASTPIVPEPQPARSQRNEVEEDDDDPFADRNAVETPMVERGEPMW